MNEFQSPANTDGPVAALTSDLRLHLGGVREPSGDIPAAVVHNVFTVSGSAITTQAARVLAFRDKRL